MMAQKHIRALDSLRTSIQVDPEHGHNLSAYEPTLAAQALKLLNIR